MQIQPLPLTATQAQIDRFIVAMERVVPAAPSETLLQQLRRWMIHHARVDVMNEERRTANAAITGEDVLE